MADGPSSRRVRIAVVDSGVEPGHPHILAERLLPGVSISAEGVMETGATADALGHGTAVTAAIQQWAPQADITPIRVFTGQLRTSPRALLLAIQYCIDHGFDLVNLSLGTRVPEHGPVFAQAAAIAREEGVVLVAAHSAAGDLCYPGCLPDALGVALDWDIQRGAYRMIRGNEGDPAQSLGLKQGRCAASGFPRPIPGVEQRRNLFGVSFAVANMTGLAAGVLAASDSFRSGREDEDAATADRLSGLIALLSSSAAAGVCAA